ncbi:MAG: TIGR02647 family protein [Gammaproteobacteria bacterium]
MKLSTELVQELEVLSLFPRESTQMGLKFHHDADPEHIAAAKRLYDKQLISLEDGGYLTDLGLEAADHGQALLSILQS